MKKITYILKCANRCPCCISCGSTCYKNLSMSQKKTAKKIDEIEFCNTRNTKF